MRIFDRLGQHKTLSVMPTFQCTAECGHCGTLSSPRDKTWLPVDAMLDAIDQAADLGYEVVVFTGGEPTLALKHVLLGLERATARGLRTRVVTNAYWAVNEDAARRRIAELTSAGLKEINFSTGDQHTRFVPVERVIRATRAAAEAGLVIAVMVEVVSERRVTKQTVESHPEYIRIVHDFPDHPINLHESPWMPLTPLAKNKYPEGIAANAANLPMRTGCDSVLSTTTIQADGGIGACCGIGMRLIPELQLGNVRDTSLADAERRATDDFLKRWIRVEGPERILAWAAGHDPSIDWEDRYAHRCQACLRLYKDPKVRAVISERHKEKVADVIFAEWLMFQFEGEYSESGEPVLPRGGNRESTGQHLRRSPSPTPRRRERSQDRRRIASAPRSDAAVVSAPSAFATDDLGPVAGRITKAKTVPGTRR